ncbi:helix-turn-helix domain-containing protein [Sphingobacterium sp. Mn56C]|uniref:helix-turn-helix domain-containing protein n=1 Tax=Sphingobacterium sp. Mn56C TaxID=3395261 RepID=UPI003BC04696
MSQIGINIKKLRKVKSLSQQAFADLFNLSRGNISSYEEFRAEPRIEVVLQIAKYFSIPVAELLEKQLTVNEILNFEDHFFEDQPAKNSNTLTAIPFIGRELFQQEKVNWLAMDQFPQIFLPTLTKHKLIALENVSYIARPNFFPFPENSILFFEQVQVDILHTLDQHFGFYQNGEEFFFGKYLVAEKKIEFVLNDWKKVRFDLPEAECFWKLYGSFERKDNLVY